MPGQPLPKFTTHHGRSGSAARWRTNFAGAGRAKLERAVTNGIAAAGFDAAATQFEAACFGMSGGPDDKRQILQRILRVKRLVVTNDAVIALAGATESGEGIITIGGTGS